MARRRTYSDEQLRRAIAMSTSWRGVLRELNLVATSAGAMRSVRAHADRIGAVYVHFRGQRRWTDEELRSATRAAATWTEVAAILGDGHGSALAALKGHAARLNLDVGHLEPPPTEPAAASPDIAYLRRAGSLLAAAWFVLCGHEVSWPLEPGRYDLLTRTDQRIRRVQVKTTTVRAGDTWKVYLSTSHRGRKTYDPDEIDDFFIIDGAFAYYLIPVAVVGGLQAIHLRRYARYRLPQLDASGGRDRSRGG